MREYSIRDTLKTGVGLAISGLALLPGCSSLISQLKTAPTKEVSKPLVHCTNKEYGTLEKHLSKGASDKPFTQIFSLSQGNGQSLDGQLNGRKANYEISSEQEEICTKGGENYGYERTKCEESKKVGYVKAIINGDISTDISSIRLFYNLDNNTPTVTSLNIQGKSKKKPTMFHYNSKTSGVTKETKEKADLYAKSVLKFVLDGETSRYQSCTKQRKLEHKKIVDQLKILDEQLGVKVVKKGTTKK